jgi:hypothetical protein
VPSGRRRHHPGPRAQDPISSFVPKSFDSPEETRPVEDIKGKLDIINVEPVPSVAAPSPVGGTPSPSNRAPGPTAAKQSTWAYFICGRMTIVMNGGEETEFGPVT